MPGGPLRVRHQAASARVGRGAPAPRAAARRGGERVVVASVSPVMPALAWRRVACSASSLRSSVIWRGRAGGGRVAGGGGGGGGPGAGQRGFGPGRARAGGGVSGGARAPAPPRGA